MDEATDLILATAGEKMASALAHLEKSLLKIRAGKASPAMLGGVYVDYYGAQTPLSQVSNINTPDARTLSVQPWDRGLLEAIEKAIQEAGLGFNPSNDGEVIRINIPALTEERRRELAKQARQEAEVAKVSARTARKEANRELHKLGQEGCSEDLIAQREAEIQALTDEHIAKIDAIAARKEAEIMNV